MSDSVYHELSPTVTERIKCDKERGFRFSFAARDDDAIRRDPTHDTPTVWRTPYIRDTEKIIHSPYYNRYTDKTQVFSLYRNDDLTRRALHVQLVSRTARTIGATLGLSLDLIEAIALGHDIGHTPFGHAGERYLSELTEEYAGKCFCHNIHSVRVLDRMFHLNLTLQTLNGIAAHNGEVAIQHYKPRPMTDFDVFDEAIDACYRDASENARWIPSTMEGCVVRLCDMIAYVGKDRQDARRLGLIASDDVFSDSGIGVFNAAMIHNMEVDIIENSYGKDAITLSPESFAALRAATEENYEKIYLHPTVRNTMEEKIRPLMRKIFEKLLREWRECGERSILFRHHVQPVEAYYRNRSGYLPYRETAPETLVADFIAGMTDDYFLDLCRYYFPNGDTDVRYVGYFENL